jgi:hypothetical protein
VGHHGLVAPQLLRDTPFGPSAPEEGALTVCIAARCYSSVFLISDRMITAGDIQFEPQTPKIAFLTSAIAVMASGDSGFHAEVLTDVLKEVVSTVAKEPDKWLYVKDVVDLYVKKTKPSQTKKGRS